MNTPRHNRAAVQSGRKRRLHPWCVLAAWGVMVLLPSPAFGIDALTIVRRADSTMRGTSSYTEIVMTIVKPEWSRTLSLKAWMLGGDYGLILVTDPARDRGTVTLKRNTEVWNYLPGIDRVIKIPPSMMLQSWLGSDFTNDDLVQESSVVEDYVHALRGDTTIDGHPCYMVTMIPKEEAPVVWGRVELYVSKDLYLQLRSEMYDEDGALSRVLTADRIRTMDRRTLPSRWTMQPTDKPAQRTVMEYNRWQYNIDLDESFFSQQNMRRIR